MRILFSLLCLCAAPALADSPQIAFATGSKSGQTWRFDVTVKHADEGWDHYADGWYILAPDGTELGYRKLLHPHVDEQPFTRSLSNVTLPANTSTVIIRAHDLVHGDGPDYILEIK